jgi:hypothetical protein
LHPALSSFAGLTTYSLSAAELDRQAAATRCGCFAPLKADWKTVLKEYKARDSILKIIETYGMPQIGNPRVKYGTDAWCQNFLKGEMAGGGEGRYG